MASAATQSHPIVTRSGITSASVYRVPVAASTTRVTVHSCHGKGETPRGTLARREGCMVLLNSTLGNCRRSCRGRAVDQVDQCLSEVQRRIGPHQTLLRAEDERQPLLCGQLVDRWDQSSLELRLELLL